MYDDYIQMRRYAETLQRARQEYQAAQRQRLLLEKRFAYLYERVKKALSVGPPKAAPKPDGERVAY